MLQILSGMKRWASEAVRWQVVQRAGEESGGVSRGGGELDSMRRVRRRRDCGEMAGGRGALEDMVEEGGVAGFKQPPMVIVDLCLTLRTLREYQDGPDEPPRKRVTFYDGQIP